MKKKIITVFSVLIAVTVTVEAANFGTSRTIDVTDGVSVYMDGNELEMKNEEGKDVDAFIYDGTTYLPARAISEANGNSVKWDGGSGRVNITSNKPKSKKNPNLANVAAEEDKYYIFELSDNVNRTHVTYKNRYGIEIAADLYTSKDLDEIQSYPALVIGPPYGGVKEQGPGVYANQLAQRGFVVIAFDPSYNGESGGEPRHTSSPEIFSEDFSAGVDYLGSLNYVNREQIGAIGICGSGGFALSAAAMDTRIKAVATAAMYDISAMGNSMDNESRNTMIGELSEKRWDDYISGAPTYTRTYPEDKPLDELPQHLTGLDVEWWTFYGLKRGWHPNAGGAFTNASMLPFSNYPILEHIDGISPRPVLFITGDIAHSKEYSETAYEAANEPKELYVVPNAMHIDLYDDIDKIPFDKIESFFKTAFNI